MQMIAFFTHLYVCFCILSMVEGREKNNYYYEIASDSLHPVLSISSNDDKNQVFSLCMVSIPTLCVCFLFCPEDFNVVFSLIENHVFNSELFYTGN